MTGGKARTHEAGLSLELVIECADETVATALNEALMPDNRYFPKDQRFHGLEAGEPRPLQRRLPQGEARPEHRVEHHL